MDAKLIWCRTEKNKNGFPVEMDECVEVFATEKEIARSEFYEAMRNGIAVKKILEVRTEDFELSRHTDKNNRLQYASKVEFEGETYKIIKTYGKGKSKIELTCGDV